MTPLDILEDPATPKHIKDQGDVSWEQVKAEETCIRLELDCCWSVRIITNFQGPADKYGRAILTPFMCATGLYLWGQCERCQKVYWAPLRDK